MSELLGKIFDADAFGDRDIARDRHAAHSTPPCAAAACSPSSGLLLHHAEHSAGRAGARALRDARPDEPVPEAEAPDQLRADALQSELCAWDASDGAHRDAAADAADLRAARRHRTRTLKNGLSRHGTSRRGTHRAARAPDSRCTCATGATDAAAALCKPDAAPSAAQSCAARAVAAAPALQAALLDAAQPRRTCGVAEAVIDGALDAGGAITSRRSVQDVVALQLAARWPHRRRGL